MTQPGTTHAQPGTFDLAIVGAGPVGAALALMLAQRAPALRIALIDARRPPLQYDADPRALALSHGSRLSLERLGAWPSGPRETTPIQHIHVSQRRHFGRVVIDHREHGVPALGYVVRYGTVMRALDARLDVLPTETFSHLRQTRATAHRQDNDAVTLTLEQDAGATTLRAALAINAEGGLFSTQQQKPRTRDYRQSALVAFVTCDRPLPSWAWERFTAEGPLALLPLENGYSLVWCCPPALAEQRLQLPDDAFLTALNDAFGTRMGRFTSVSGRAVFPLGLNALPHLVDGRIAAIGNAAQTLHPVAGQGLNLGLRDAFALTEAICRTSPPDVSPAALSRFARQRAIDRQLTIGLTDLLPRLFSNDATPLATLRGLALAGLELVPPLKTAFARQMMFGQRR